MGAQWLLCIDPDERLEMAASERIKTMTTVIEPVAWQFRLRELYTPTAYRVDGRWKKKTLTCLFPLLDGQIFSDAPLHGRRSPLNPEYEKATFRVESLSLEDDRPRTAPGPPRFLSGARSEGRLSEDRPRLSRRRDGPGPQGGAPSRQYRPLHREAGGNWQPDLAALRPIAENAGVQKALAQATVPALINSARIWRGKARASPR